MHAQSYEFLKEIICLFLGFGGCKFITFEDKNWHSECFNCTKCNSSLVGRGFLVEDGVVVCPDCST